MIVTVIYFTINDKLSSSRKLKTYKINFWSILIILNIELFW